MYMIILKIHTARPKTGLEGPNGGVCEILLERHDFLLCAAYHWEKSLPIPDVAQFK